MLEIGEAVGLELNSGAGEVPPRCRRWPAERDAARTTKDFVRAPTHCATEIQAAGWVVEDTPAGTVVRIP